MTKDLYINGPAMVKVKGMGALAVDDGPVLKDLGITSGPIRIIPNIIHRDVYADDFGNDIPAEIMITGMDCQIHMTLIHYDDPVLQQCIRNSVGNYEDVYNVNTGDNPDALDDQGIDITALSRAGYLGGVGKMMGNGKQRFEEGNLFISLSITAQSIVDPEDARQSPTVYRFPTAYIAANPMEIPLGTDRTAVTVRWRAIAYRPPVGHNTDNRRVSTNVIKELKSKGVPVWDRRNDTDD